MAIIIPTEKLLGFYAEGLFPMADERGRIGLYSPDPRGVIPFDSFKVPRGARKEVADHGWEYRMDTAFEEVLAGCASREETWIDDVIANSYIALHRAGHAHSLEVWRDGALAGGLYGVRLGGAFFGESMFHRIPGASKAGLAKLVSFLRANGFTLLDTQWTTPHLALFGGKEIPRSEYLHELENALRVSPGWDLSLLSMPNACTGHGL